MADQRRQHPGRGERAEDARVQHRRVDARDDDVEADVDGAGTEALQQATRDEDEHVGRRTRQHETNEEDENGGDERTRRTATVCPPAGDHHADDTRREGTGESERIERFAVQFGADGWHDRRHRERFECPEENEREGADGRPEIASGEDTGGP